MDKKLLQIYEQYRQRGLTAEQDVRMRAEMETAGSHEIPCEAPLAALEADHLVAPLGLYGWSDLCAMQGMEADPPTYSTQIRSIEELLARDRQREKDGFPRKIRIGKLIKPGSGAKGQVIIVPTTQEEKFLHDTSQVPPEQGGGGQSGGTGDEEEGEVIGEQPVRPQPGPGQGQAGQGEGGSHDIEANAYDLGRILTEKFELPNLKEKGKKRSLTRYTYDLTDRNRGFGQVLDKKQTLRQILETNIGLGRVPDVDNIDPTGFLIAPKDKIYRILSKEKDLESQAVVFFVRDYSGSMGGKSTDVVVTQHVLIYSWLLYQYQRQVEVRFILHDTEAKEVEDFETYHNSKVAGGTQVAAAYKLVNEIVEKESLAKDYNIYVFHGTDGDDWDTDGRETLPELIKMLTYASRVGITIAEHVYTSSGSTEVQKYIKKSGLLEDKPQLLRLDTMGEDAEEGRIIDGIKKLIS